MGYGLEGGLTDALSSIIVQREILPDFRANNYAAGVRKSINAILKAIEGEYTAPARGARGNHTDPVSEKLGSFIPLIFIAMVGIPELLRRKGLRKAANGAFAAGFAGLLTTLASGGNLWIGLAITIAVFLFVNFKGSSDVGGSGGNHYGGYGPSSRKGSGGFGGGGFSGGGGSFGGGGAS